MATYTHDYDGFGAFLRGPGMQGAMRQVAGQIERRAKALAEPHRKTGEYLDSFEIEVGLTADGERAQAVVRNTSDHAAAVEFGTQHQEAQRILGRAADA